MASHTSKRSVTIADVARHAGVSIATVSRVLNGTAPVTPDTIERVQAAIRELHYVPSTAARVLASSKKNTIGLLFPEISGAFFVPLLSGIEAVAREQGYDLLIHTTNTVQLNQIPVHRKLGEHNTDGLIIFTDSVNVPELERLHFLGFPMVLLHQSPPPGLTIPTVTVENKDGACNIVKHLIESHGRRRIAFLRGPEQHEDSLWRERGYREALVSHQIPFDPDLIAQGNFDHEAAQSAVLGLIRRGIKFDGIFTGDDESAIGVLRALQGAGLRVPEDISVVGFDDVTPAPYLHPALTTVHAPIDEVGRTAVRQLLHQIEGEPVELLTRLPTRLVVRHSCGCG